MTEPIVMSFPHTVGAEKAKETVDEGARKLFEEYGQYITEHSVRWTGYHADTLVGVLGTKIRGELDIFEASVRIRVYLPWALAPVRGQVKEFLASKAKLLGLPEPR